MNEISGTAVARLSARNAAVSDAVFLDIRGGDEWATGHIEGALHRPLDRFDPAAVPSAPLVLVCRSGLRAEQAATLLREASHPHDVWILDGGILAWTRSGYSIVTCSGSGRGGPGRIR